MKYVLIIPDGAADEPQESLGGKTPLEAANIPAIDALAQAGVVGAARHVPASLPAGSAVANMSLLGYDPIAHFTGRAPLEAAAQGIELGPEDWAVRCNLVTIAEQIMTDFTADHISTEEASRLLATAQEQLGSDSLQFVPGVSYRNLLLYRGEGGPAPFSSDTRSTPPHDLTGKSIQEDYPRGPGSELLSELMEQSLELFADHPVNMARKANGKLPATNIWLWGQGRRPSLKQFGEIHGLRGAMITAVDLLRGIAALIGWDLIEVPGATGYTDTDYKAKGSHAVRALENVDLVCVHIEAPDEASHEGDAAAKVEAIEQIDRHIVAPIHEALKGDGEFRILICPDHPTFLRTKTHSHGNVPFVLAGAGIEADTHQAYHDKTANASKLQFPEGWKLMQHFVKS